MRLKTYMFEIQENSSCVPCKVMNGYMQQILENYNKGTDFEHYGKIGCLQDSALRKQQQNFKFCLQNTHGHSAAFVYF